MIFKGNFTIKLDAEFVAEAYEKHLAEKPKSLEDLRTFCKSLLMADLENIVNHGEWFSEDFKDAEEN